MKLVHFNILVLIMFFTSCGKNHYLIQDPNDLGNLTQNITDNNSGGSSGGSNGGSNGGSDPTPQSMTEFFFQTAETQKKVDFLWVIDNSGSMQQEQNNLASNFSTFIQGFLAKNVDFKMAITTTDTSGSGANAKCGKIVSGSDTKLTTSKADQNESQFITDFETLIKVGTNGSGSEQGLKASHCFANTTGVNFLRPEAYLAVIYVSDEEDQSPFTAAQIISNLQSKKANPGLIKAYSIVNTTGQTFGQTLTLGFQKYADVSTETNGSYFDIFSNFSQSLLEIGDQIINLLESFPLKHQPILGTVIVKINGEVIPDSHYTIENSSIKFNAGHLPSAGSAITVEYQY